MPIFFVLAIVLVLIVGSLSAVYLRPKEAALEMVPVPHLSARRDKKRKQLHTLLIAWADETDKHGVGAWLHALSPEDLQTLTKDVTVYAKDMGFDLLWVLDGQIDDVDLYDHVNQTLFKYVQSFYLASRFQDDMQLYKVMVDFLNNMNSRRFRPKAEKIYMRLNQLGVVQDIDVEVLFKKRKIRWQHVENSIREAAQSNRAALKLAVNDVILLNQS